MSNKVNVLTLSEIRHNEQIVAADTIVEVDENLASHWFDIGAAKLAPSREVASIGDSKPQVTDPPLDESKPQEGGDTITPPSEGGTAAQPTQEEIDRAMADAANA